jgi:hypothetical protein
MMFIGCDHSTEHYEDPDSEQDSDSETDSQTEFGFEQCIELCGEWRYTWNKYETEQFVICREQCEQSEHDSLVNDCIIDYALDAYDCWDDSTPSAHNCVTIYKQDLCDCASEADMVDDIVNDVSSPNHLPC